MPGYDGYDLWHNENGSITFQCTPTRVGTYKISVEFEGVPLTGLPVCCVVQKAGEGYVTAYKAGPEADLDIDLNSSGAVANVLAHKEETDPAAETLPTEIQDPNTVSPADLEDALVDDDDDDPDDPDDPDDGGGELIIPNKEEEEESQTMEGIETTESSVTEQQQQQHAVLLAQADGQLLQAETLHIQPVTEDTAVDAVTHLITSEAVHHSEGIVIEQPNTSVTATSPTVMPEHAIVEFNDQYKEEVQEVLEGVEEGHQYQEIHYIQEELDPSALKVQHDQQEEGEANLEGAVAMEIADLPQEMADIKPIVDLGVVVNEGSKFILEKAPGDPNAPEGPIYVIKEQIEGGHILMHPETSLDHQPTPAPEPVRPPTKRRRGRPPNPRSNSVPIIIGPTEVSLPKSFTQSIKASAPREDDGVVYIGPNMNKWQRTGGQTNATETIVTEEQDNEQQLLQDSDSQVQQHAIHEDHQHEHHQILEQRVLGEDEIRLIAAAESQHLAEGSLQEGALSLMELVGQDGTIVTEQTDENTTLLVIKNEQGGNTNFVEDADGNVLQVVEPEATETETIVQEHSEAVEEEAIGEKRPVAEAAPQEPDPKQDESGATLIPEVEGPEPRTEPDDAVPLEEQPKKADKTQKTAEALGEQPPKKAAEPPKTSDPDLLSPSRRSRRVAQRKKTFKCNKMDCDDVFETLEEFEEHSQKVHKERGTYICPEVDCKRVFPTRKTFKFHVKRAHQKEVDDEYKIPCSIKICPKLFKSEALMKQHLEEQHIKQEKKEGEAPEEPEKKEQKPKKEKQQRRNKRQKTHDKCENKKKEADEEGGNKKEEEDKMDDSGDQEQQEINEDEFVEQEISEAVIVKMEQDTKSKMFMCEQCGKTCGNKSSLNAHLETHFKQTRFVCEEDGCSKVFRNQALLERHKLKHQDGVWCKECNRSFKSEEAYQKHYRRVHCKDDPSYNDKECHVCGKDFATKSAMLKHIQNIHNDSSMPCPICNKVFKTKENMDRHKKYAHSEAKPFMCDLCGSFFKTKDILRCHREGMHRTEQVWETPFGSDTPVLVERAIRPFECKYCHRTFKRKAVMKEHVMAAHESTEVIPCTHPGCQKTFPTKTLMKTHVRSTHRIKDIRMECTFEGCTKWFNTKSALMVHENTHKNIRYQCLQQGCQMSFTTKHHMLMHYKLKHTHLDEKFACSICGKRFKLKEQVKAHLDCHKTERLYKCDICGKGFITKSRLTSHRKIHNVESGELDCVYCGKTFGRKYRLQQHMAKHTQEITVAYSIE